tara:strand:+ start:1088 stop:1516 length:429 start_codon:yes stop_codon:yes gene_type:complete
MTLEQLYNETEKDLAPLNKELLEVEASNQASLHDKYLKLFIQSGAEYRMIKQKYDYLLLQKRHYYLGKGTKEDYEKKPFDLNVIKSDLDFYLNADEDLQEIQTKLDYHKLKIDFLEKTLSAIRSRGYDIKSAIDWIKFKNGL